MAVQQIPRDMYHDSFYGTSNQGKPLSLREALQDSSWENAATQLGEQIIEVVDDGGMYSATSTGELDALLPSSQASWEELTTILEKLGISVSSPLWVGDHSPSTT